MPSWLLRAGGMACCFALAFALVGCREEGESPTGERWFVPKYGPIEWFREAENRIAGGQLPNSGKFLIKKKLGNVFEIELKAGELGYVSAVDGIVTPIAQSVTFTKEINFEHRPTINFWLGEREITDFLSKNVVQNVRHDLEENLSSKWEPLKIALPILAFRTVPAKSTKREMKIARTVIRLPLPSNFASLEVADKEPDRIIFVVDVSNEMLPVGRQLLLSTLERLAAKDARWRNDKQIGIVLFRDERSDGVKLHSFKPFGVAADVLQTATFADGKTGASKPLIDAIHLGLMNLHGRDNSRDIVIAFAAADVHPIAKGTGPYRASKGMTMRALVEEFRNRRVNFILVQATPERGNELQRMLENIGRFGGVRAKSIPYQANLERIVVSALEKFLLEEERTRLTEESVQILGRRISAVGGVPVYPRTLDFRGTASKIGTLVGPIPSGAQWVNVPVWIVAEQPTLKIQ